MVFWHSSLFPACAGTFINTAPLEWWGICVSYLCYYLYNSIHMLYYLVLLKLANQESFFFLCLYPQNKLTPKYMEFIQRHLLYFHCSFLTFWSILACCKLSVFALSLLRIVVRSLAIFWICRLNSWLMALLCSTSLTLSWI